MITCCEARLRRTLYGHNQSRVAGSAVARCAESNNPEPVFGAGRERGNNEKPFSGFATVHVFPRVGTNRVNAELHNVASALWNGIPILTEQHLRLDGERLFKCSAR